MVLTGERVAMRPSQVAKTARIQRAKRLLDETDLSMTDIALRSGFGSLRRFNDVFLEVYKRSPTEIRRTRRSPRATVLYGFESPSRSERCPKLNKAPKPNHGHPPAQKG